MDAQSLNTEVILRRFDSPDEVRTLTKGKFEVVRLGGATAAFDDGRIVELRPGELFYIPPSRTTAGSSVTRM